MTDIKAKLSVNLGGDFIPMAQRYAERMNRFSLSMTRSMRALRAEARFTNAALGAHGGGLNTGAARADITALNQAVHSLTSGLGHMDSQLHLNTQALSQFRREAGQAGGAAVRLQGNMSRMGSRMGMLSYGKAGALALAATGAMAAKSFLNKDMELEDAMLQVKSNLVSGAKDAADLNHQLKQVRDTARELSETTKFSDAEMVQVTNQLLKSGVSEKDVHGRQGAAAGAAGLAQLGGVPFQEAAAVLGSTASAFGMNGKQIYDFANHMVKVDDASGENSGQLVYNWQQVNASAMLKKIDPKKMISALGYSDTLMNEGGTALNRFLENLGAPTRQKNKAMESSGMHFYKKTKDGRVQLKDPDEIFEIIRKKFSGMKDEHARDVLLHRMFGEDGGKFAALIASKSTSFADFERKVESSAGMAQKLEIQMSGLSGACDRLGNTVLSLADEQFAGLRGVLTDIVNYTNEGLQGIRSVNKDVQNFATKSASGIWEWAKGTPDYKTDFGLKNGANSSWEDVLNFGLKKGEDSSWGDTPPQKVEVTLKNLSDTPLKLKGTSSTPGTYVSLKNSNTNARAGSHF